MPQRHQQLRDLVLDAVPVKLECLPVKVVVRDTKVVDHHRGGFARQLADDLLPLRSGSVGSAVRSSRTPGREVIGGGGISLLLVVALAGMVLAKRQDQRFCVKMLRTISDTAQR